MVTSDGPTLQDKIELLVALPMSFAYESDMSGTPNSVGERVKVIAQAAGISDSLLNALRLGHRNNPTAKTMQKLANLYRLDPAYFTDGPTGTEIYRQLRLLKQMGALKQTHVSELRVAFRDHFGLSDKGAETALQMLEQLRDLEAGLTTREP